MPTVGEPGRSTTSRIFALLHAFEQSGRSMSLTELARSSGLPVTTTHRIAHELMAVGALERTPEGTLQVGMRLWELGSLAPRQLRLRRLARPHMDGLHEATEQTVQLVVLEEGRALCIEKISDRRSVSNVTEVARWLPLHATGVGKVLLAFEPGLLDELRGTRLRRFTARTVCAHDRLTTEVEEVVRTGIAYCREEMTVGTASTAAPVFGPDGALVAALGVLTASPQALPRYAVVTQDAARAMSRRLGWSASRDGAPPVG